MTDLCDAVFAFLLKGKWNLFRVRNGSEFFLEVATPRGVWLCMVRVFEDSRLAVHSVCPSKVPPSKHPTVSEFLERINDGLILGNFEMSRATGIVSFKTSIDITGETLSERLFENLLVGNLKMMDRFLPALMAIIYCGASPEAAIRSARTNGSVTSVLTKEDFYFLEPWEN